MDRGPEQTLLPRRHTYGQQVYEKMLNFTNYYGNENHYHLTPVGMTIINKTMTGVGEVVEKKEPSFTVGGNVNWYSHYGKQYGASSKNI